MEISINLLPQTNSRKEKRSVYLIPVLGIAAVMATASFFTYSYIDKKDSLKTLSENITAQTAARDNLINELQVNTAGVTEFNITDKYIQLNQFLNTIYEDTIDLHKSVNGLLPDKAEVVTYTYLNNGDLTMTISFYSKGDSAIYLHRLLNADFVDKAEVENISAIEEELTYESIFQIKLKTIAGAEK